MDEVQQIKEDLDTRFALAPNEFPLDDIKTIYLHNAIGIKNADKRIDELSSEYNKIMDKHKISIDMLNDKEDADIKNASESIDKLILNDKRTDEENKEFNNAVKKLELTDNDLRDLKQVKQNYEEIKTLDTKDFLDRVNEQYKDLQKIRKFSAIDHNKLLTIVNDLIRLREKRFNTVALHNYLDKNITSPKLEELLTNIKTAVHNRTIEAKKVADKLIKDKELSKEREQLNLEMNDNSDFTALENKYPNLKQDIRKYKKDLDNRNKALDAEFINKIYNATTVEQLDELSKSTLGSKH
ncbi:MAG TPA: hypothetical protein PLC53_02775, partial [Bacilli bacterium]|nr:hypothetical protein [Bacilli bacterium]